MAVLAGAGIAARVAVRRPELLSELGTALDCGPGAAALAA